jgi:hypothetical protein
MTRRRWWTFLLLSVSISMTGTVGVLLAADLYVHHRAEKSAGLNRWGYRGPVLGKKRAGETRVGMLGGSTVFGYGVSWPESLPALLERELQREQGNPSINVVNLGFNNEGAFALEPTLRDFSWLDLDVAIFYVGYNDRWGDESPNTAVYRHESAVSRMFGYFPLLPLVLKEKAVALRTGGRLVAANNATVMQAAKPVFSPNLADRTSAGALEAVVRLSDAMSAQINKMTPSATETSVSLTGDCGRPWASYCDALHRAVSYARSHDLKVLVVLPPLMTRDTRALHQDQQRASRMMVERRFGADRGVRCADLSGAVDLTDRHYSFDEMHLDQDGNAVVAKGLAPAVLALVRGRI